MLSRAIPNKNEFEKLFLSVEEYMNELRQISPSEGGIVANHSHGLFPKLRKKTHEQILTIFLYHLKNVAVTDSNREKVIAYEGKIKELKQQVAEGIYPSFNLPNYELVEFTNNVFDLPQIDRKRTESMSAEIHRSSSPARRIL